MGGSEEQKERIVRIVRAIFDPGAELSIIAFSV